MLDRLGALRALKCIRTLAVCSAAHSLLLYKCSVSMIALQCRKYTHPRKAALHTAAFSAASHLSTAAHHHDPASAIVRAALREVTARCEASPSARLSCLNTLSQLDRLRPGSQSERLNTSGIAPRMRGDVHADLTAATLTLTAPQPRLTVPLRRPNSVGKFTAKMFRLGSSDDLIAAARGSPVASPRSGHISSSPLGTTPGSPLAVRSADGGAARDTAGKGQDVMHGGAQPCSHGAHGMHGGASGSAYDALAVKSLPGSPLSSCGFGGEGGSRFSGSRRWGLLRVYVGVLMRERRLRRDAWAQVSGAVLQQALSSRGSDGDSVPSMTPSSSSSSLQLVVTADWDGPAAVIEDIGRGNPRPLTQAV